MDYVKTEEGYEAIDRDCGNLGIVLKDEFEVAAHKAFVERLEMGATLEVGMRVPFSYRFSPCQGRLLADHGGQYYIKLGDRCVDTGFLDN